MSTLYSDLHRAIISNNAADVIELLKGGSVFDEVNIYGRTPLHIACCCVSPTIVDLLLRHNADIDIVDNGGHTALQLAMYRSTSPNRVAVLQLMATCAQTRLEASSADWIRLARNERNKRL